MACLRRVVAMVCGCEDNLGRAWRPRTRLRAEAPAQPRTEEKAAGPGGDLSVKELQRMVRLVTEALRPFSEARMAVVRALRRDAGLPELPE